MASSTPNCRVCGADIVAGLLYVCPACSTPHHAECWDYSGGCSVYGCEQSRALKLTDPRQLPTPYSPAQRVLLSTLMVPGLFFLLLGLGGLVSTQLHVGIPFVVLGYWMILRAWKDAFRPLIELNPILGTIATFLTGVLTLGLGVFALSAFLLSTPSLGGWAAGAALAVGTVRIGRETRRLFASLNDGAPALTGSATPPLLERDPADAPPVKPPPPEDF